MPARTPAAACRLSTLSCLLAASVPGIHAGEVSRLDSPDGRIEVSIRMPAPGPGERPRWSATFRGRPILSECGLGLETVDGGDLMVGVRVLHRRNRSEDARVPVLFGKSDHANDRFREVRYTLESPRQRRTDVVFRCYNDAIALLESGTLYCLNDPAVIQDTSWIKPGKITFPWWNGDVYDGQPGQPILSFEMARKYIDFCARHGLPIHSLTSTETTVTPWHQQSKPGVAPGPDTDVTRPRADFDLAAIRQYAESKQVRLWTWVHHDALRGRIDEAFAAFEKMGWSGMMVDFFDHDDQETIEFAEAILAAAARHRILPTRTIFPRKR